MNFIKLALSSRVLQSAIYSLRLFRGLCAVIFVLVVFPFGFSLNSSCWAEGGSFGVNYNFATPPGLRGRVDFWVLIFTKYGDNHRVFHHRWHPEIIYSVLDFAHYEATLSGKKLLQTRERAVERELARIRSVLNYLASGKSPRNPWEKRLEKQFAALPGTNARSKYLNAADGDILRYQRGIKERFYDGLVRSGRYLYAIEDIFRAEGLPIQAGRLPLVESSFNYEAYSSVGAAGIWQFMRATGQKYMRINYSIDERRDPIIATRAAAEYLKHAYNKLGNWPLALTSYNHGVAGMMRAVNQTGSKDLAVIIRNYKSPSFGFASGSFYPSFLAALEVDQNSKHYFPDLVREKPWRFDEIRLGRSVYFSDLAKYSRSSKEDIERLNLAFRQPILKNSTPIPAGTLVKVPHGHGPKVVASISKSSVMPLSGSVAMAGSIRDPKQKPEGGDAYQVRRGDTVGGIASRFGLHQDQLMEHNNLRDARSLRAGSTIRIPSNSTSSRPSEIKVASKNNSVTPVITRASLSSDSEIKKPSSVQYQIKKGDTVGGLAQRYGISQKELMRANGITDPRRVRLGQKIVIPGPQTSSPKSGSKSELERPKVSKAENKKYTVVSGDNLSKIAKRFSLRLSELQRLNPDVKTSLSPGQVLIVQ